MADAVQEGLAKLGEFGAALLTLEVNTIVKAGMEAGKMPTVAEALQEIATDYATFLSRERVAWQSALDDEARRGLLAIQQNTVPSPADFSNLAVAADRALALARFDKDDEDASVVRRISGQSKKLAQAMAAERIDRPSNRFVVLVRKLWDLGTEVVAMQSTLQIDGDMMTRISPSIAYEHGNNQDYDRAFVSSLHHGGLEAASRQWGNLFDLAIKLVSYLVPAK